MSSYVLRFTFCVVLIAGAALRLTHINWDQFQHVHPDERFIVWVADSVSAPEDLATALDPARSPINPFRWPPNAGDPSTGSGDPLAGKPRSYAYGHFPLYLLVVVAHGAQAVGQWLGETTLVFPPIFQPIYTVGRHLAEYDYLALVGRAISALCDLGTLVLVYALANWTFGRRSESANRRINESANQQTGESANRQTGKSANRQISKPAVHAVRNSQSAIRNPHPAAGLLAAAAYAFAVLPIQLSHFSAVDMVLTFCTVAAVALAARWAEAANGRTGESHNAQYPIPNTQYLIRDWTTWLLAGAMTGLAVGSKFSAVLLAAPLLAAACFRLGEGDWARKVVIVMGRLVAVGGVALTVFAVTNPFAIIEFVAYAGNIISQQAMVSGLMDAPYTRQYIGAAPYWYFIQQLSQWGLGWPLGLVAWGGFVWAIVRVVIRKIRNQVSEPALIVMLAWAVPYFATTGSFHTKFLRYMAPLLPFLLVFGAGAAISGYRWLRGRWGRRGQAIWTAAALAVAAFTVGWTLAFTGVYRQEHPWLQASRWIYQNIPANSKLLTEYWDASLPLRMDEVPGRPPVRAYERVELPLYDPDTPEKLDALVAELSSADYLIIASNRLYVPIGRLPGRYPMTSQYYRLLFEGGLGYRQVATFSAYPTLGRLVIPDDHADESFTVYDHPRALIFANTDRLSPSLLRARLARYLPTADEHAPLTPQSWGEPGSPRKPVLSSSKGRGAGGAIFRAVFHAVSAATTDEKRTAWTGGFSRFGCQRQKPAEASIPDRWWAIFRAVWAGQEDRGRVAARVGRVRAVHGRLP